MRRMAEGQAIRVWPAVCELQCREWHPFGLSEAIKGLEA
jgi:hypothetical protein